MNTHPFESLKRELSDGLVAAGFQQREEQKHADHFGSASAIFANGYWELRLVWDGKDRRAVLQRRLTGQQTEWVDVANVLTERDLESAAELIEIQGWRTLIAEMRQDSGTATVPVVAQPEKHDT